MTAETPVTLVPDDATLLRMADELATQRNAFHEAFQASYPVGGTVRYDWAGDIRKGTVMRQGYGDRLYVRNDETGAEYWIRGHRVLDAIRQREALRS